MGKKPNSGQIKKGEVLNPKGRPKIPEDVKLVRELNKIEVTRTISKLMYLPIRELSNVMGDLDAPMIDRMIAKVIFNAQVAGDYVALNFLLNRSIGPVQQSVKIENKNPYLEAAEQMNPDDLRAKIKAMSEQRKIIQANYTEVKKSEGGNR